MSPQDVLECGGLVYGLVVVVDIENYSKLDTLGQSRAQALLGEALDEAAVQAGLRREDWYRQPRGDGELAVLLGGVDAAWVVADFTDRLAEALARLRRQDDAGPALRLRLAMHHGTLTGGQFGPAGTAPIIACRLLDAGPVRRALVANEALDLVLVISEPLYRDVVETRFHGLTPERFRAMRIRTKGTTYSGYLCTGTPRTAFASVAGAEDLVGQVR